MDKPTFHGTTRAEFRAHMEQVATNLISVALNPGGADERTELSGHIFASTGRGFLIAVRDDEAGSPTIREAAARLHELIQDKYRKAEATNADPITTPASHPVLCPRATWEAIAAALQMIPKVSHLDDEVETICQNALKAMKEVSP